MLKFNRAAIRASVAYSVIWTVTPLWSVQRIVWDHSPKQPHENAFCVRNLNPWPNGIASQRKFSPGITCVSFGHPLALNCVVWTCDDLGRAQIRTQVHRLATQRKSTRVDHKSTVCGTNLRLAWTCEPTCELAPHCKFVRTQVWFCKLASTCIDLRVRSAGV